jgi:hypothetical protein
MRTYLWAGVTMGMALFPLSAMAQSAQPVLVDEAQFGTVHEVLGAELQMAAPRANCPAKFQPLKDGPCFDKVTLKPAAQGETRVLVPVTAPKGKNWISGAYGRDYRLYNLFPTAEGFQARELEFESSDVIVPRDCYALAGEGVGYAIEHRKSGDVAVESQTIACGGGPRQAHGPYTPEGPPLTPGPNGGWHRTEMMRVQGTMRYLAAPGQCDEQYSIRVTWCAQPAVSYLINNPDVKELDLVAARQSVRAGDILSEKEIDQWVLKRKSKKNSFKADSRWVNKSLLVSVEGCAPVESIGWWVTGQNDGLYINERALNRCGAPLAPIPTEIWEAYGDDYFIVDCGRDWRKGRPRPHGDKDDKKKEDDTQAAECFDSAGAYLRRTGRNSATVVVLNERARVDDKLHDGGYISYDVAEVRLNPDKTLSARRLDYFDPSGIYMSRCSTLNDGPAESKGFVIVRSMGISWARAYRWMSCPVY